MKRFAVIFAAAALVAACDSKPESKPSTSAGAAVTGGTAASSPTASAPSAGLSNAMAKPIQPGSGASGTVLDMSAIPAPSGSTTGDASGAPGSHLNNSYDTGTDDSATISGSNGETLTGGEGATGNDEGQGH